MTEGELTLLVDGILGVLALVVVIFCLWKAR
jgi:hypothetical protein